MTTQPRRRIDVTEARAAAPSGRREVHVASVAATMALVLSGCGGAVTAQRTHKSPVPQHEVDERTAAKTARTTADKPDSTSRALPPAMRRAMSTYKTSLANAATRDHEMESLVRQYLLMTRELFQLFRQERDRARQRANVYDPMPTWRYQAQQSFEYRLLAARSAMLTQHLRDIASALGVDLKKTDKGSAGRGQRIALYARIFHCIQADAMSRADHGRRYLAHGGGPPPRMADDRRVALYHQELTMMRRSVTCSTLTAMRRPRSVGYR